jgi:hypothetical protein
MNPQTARDAMSVACDIPFLAPFAGSDPLLAARYDFPVFT